MLLFAVLPSQIFSDLVHTDIYGVRKVMSQALVLAFPDVLLVLVSVCAFVVSLLPAYSDWDTGDDVRERCSPPPTPCSVLAGMKVIGADFRLIAFTGAESIILFTPFFWGGFSNTGAVHAGELGLSTAQNTLGDATFGRCAQSSTPCWC